MIDPDFKDYLDEKFSFVMCEIKDLKLDLKSLGKEILMLGREMTSAKKDIENIERNIEDVEASIIDFKNKTKENFDTIWTAKRCQDEKINKINLYIAMAMGALTIIALFKDRVIDLLLK